MATSTKFLKDLRASKRAGKVTRKLGTPFEPISQAIVTGIESGRTPKERADIKAAYNKTKRGPVHDDRIPIGKRDPFFDQLAKSKQKWIPGTLLHDDAAGRRKLKESQEEGLKQAIRQRAAQTTHEQAVGAQAALTKFLSEDRGLDGEVVTRLKKILDNLNSSNDRQVRRCTGRFVKAGLLSKLPKEIAQWVSVLGGS